MSSGTPPAPSDDRSGLSDLVTGIVERAGFVLDALDVRPAGRRQVVRVVVDTTDVPGRDDGPAPGVDLDAVAGVSRELSAALDAREEQGDGAAVPPGEYTLEVSTPGVDRPLTLARHWRRAWLRRVVATLADGSEVAGRVGPVTDDETVTLAVAGRKGRATDVELRALALGEVASAAVEVEFKPAPQAEVDALRAARGGTTEETGDAGTTPGKDDET